MQTVSGVGSSLWVKRSAGIYPSVARRRFPINGLVLYVPLWHPELHTSPFTTKEPTGHSCTTTNVTWGTQGAAFAGDGYIINSTADWRRSDNVGTIMVWFKSAATANQALFASSDEASDIKFLSFYTQTPNGVLAVNVYNDGNDAIRGSTSVDDDVWHLGTLTSDGSTWTLYVDDGAADTPTILVGANDGGWLADTATTRDNFSIGSIRKATPGNYMTGTIGEVWVYSTTLTALEIKNVYLNTKWRY